MVQSELAAEMIRVTKPTAQHEVTTSTYALGGF